MGTKVTSNLPSLSYNLVCTICIKANDRLISEIKWLQNKMHSFDSLQGESE